MVVVPELGFHLLMVSGHVGDEMSEESMGVPVGATNTLSLEVDPHLPQVIRVDVREDMLLLEAQALQQAAAVL